MRSTEGSFRDPLVQDLLDGILRHPLGRFGEARIAALGALEGILDHRKRAAEQRRREYDVGWIVVGERRYGAQRLRDAPAPHVLHRARIGGLGARLGARS